jgi:hypothetical protein
MYKTNDCEGEERRNGMEEDRIGLKFRNLDKCAPLGIISVALD